MRKLPAVVLALLCAIGIVLADEPPLQKEGLWSIHRQSVDNPGNVKSESSEAICRNHAYDEHVRSMAKNVPGCKVVNESLGSGTYSIEMECTVAGTVIKSKGTTTFQENTAHVETHATYTPAFHGLSETTMVMDQKYMGGCPAGAQPGDITHADGSVTHTWKH